MEGEGEKGREMDWKKEYLDVILVPSGLCLVLGYHLFLIFRCIRFPQTTVIGYENHFRLAWVERMLQTEPKNRGISLQVIASTTTAATSLASISLALSSLIGTLVGSSLTDILKSPFIYGDTRPTIISIKHISLLICFLVAFASFIQCIRCLVHSSFLISMPYNDIPVKYVQREIIRGGLFWCIGLRAIYFATNLLLWIFGPIPMFISSVVMVALLNFLDTNSTPLHQFQNAHLL